MKKLVICLFIALSLSCLADTAYAANLIDVYQQALLNDQVYQAAKSTRLSTREALPQSMAGLLPSVSGAADNFSNITNIFKAPIGTTSPGQSATGPIKYNNNDYSVTLTQPLFNFANWMQVQQASNTAKQADATFAAAAQNLIIRVAQAYFNVLQAQDVLLSSQAQRDANARQLDQAQQRFNVGLDAITTVYNAKAQYDAAVAQVISDQNNLRNNQEALRQLTGQYYPSIEGFKVEMPLMSPQPADVEQWVNTAIKQNLSLLAQRYAVQAALANVKVNFAGHMPSINGVASYARNNGQSYGTINSSNKVVGVQLNLPIFQGGLVVSQTRQAEDNYATASANMKNTYLQTVVSTRQQYNNVLTGISKIKADRQAIMSAQSSLASTEEAYKVGTRTIVDVLLAVQNLYLQKRTYAQDEYAYLNSTLQLKQAAGTLMASDLQSINKWFCAAETPVPEKPKT